MASVLAAAGFDNLESLQEFCNRFPNVSVFLDDDLDKIWVCHKNLCDLPKNEEVGLLPSEDYKCTAKKILKKIAAGKRFYSLLTEFSALNIFKKIHSAFKKQLTVYLFTKCYLFYNWGINAFEPVIDHVEVYSRIQKREKRAFRRAQRRLPYNYFDCLRKAGNSFGRKACDLSRNQLVPLKYTKHVSFNALVKAVKGESKFYNYLKNNGNPYQEKFNLKRILYDMKQRPWPRCHVLNKGVDDLFKFVIQVPVVTDSPIESELLGQYQKWELLREFLEIFIKNHERLRRNDGYGRILKKHLKSVKTPTNGRLHPIPKGNICSYVFDILRRALPSELFGGNRLRKTFFSQLIKVINGSKNQNFIWHPLLRRLLLNKSQMPWCSQLGGNYVQSQMILKLFKFLIIHYVFVILRNNFYITETGSSGFALRFYRKSDMESASSACLKNLLRQGYMRERDQDENDSIERNWLNTGLILESDLKKKLKKSMPPGTEYTQPVAHVRFLPKSDSGDDLRLITNIVPRARKRSQANCPSKSLEKYFKARLAKRKRNLYFVKLFLQYLVDKRGFGIKPLPSNRKLEAAWTKAVYLKEKYGKLFFVKADISDAFGSVNHDILNELLKEAFEDEVREGKVELKKIIEWKMVNSRIQKVVRFSFGNRTSENSVMINRSSFLCHDRKINHYLDVKFLEIINQVVMQQDVEIKGRIYRLTKGLAQGSAGKFSTQLCEIYYSSMDNSLFGGFINSSDSILVRGVDDYLFITSDLEKARGFLEIVQNGIPGYDIRFNAHKLKSNLMQDVNEVLYLGLVFNFEEVWVKPSYSKYQQTDFLSAVNLNDKWEANHFNKELFLKRRSLRLKCLKLHSIVTSRIVHSFKIIRRTIFEACLMQSLRVLTLADHLFPGNVKNDSSVYRTLLLSCSRIKKMMSSCDIPPDEMNWIFFFSTFNILHKYSGQFRILFVMIRYRLQRLERSFADNGTELLLNLLKTDILDENYWEEVRGRFKELAKRPLKASDFFENLVRELALKREKDGFGKKKKFKRLEQKWRDIGETEKSNGVGHVTDVI